MHMETQRTTAWRGEPELRTGCLTALRSQAPKVKKKSWNATVVWSTILVTKRPPYQSNDLRGTPYSVLRNAFIIMGSTCLSYPIPAQGKKQLPAWNKTVKITRSITQDLPLASTPHRTYVLCCTRFPLKLPLRQGWFGDCLLRDRISMAPGSMNHYCAVETLYIIYTYS